MRQAASLGDPESQCGLVLWALAERDRVVDVERCIHWLMQAARSRYAPALRCLGLAAAAHGDIESAKRWFELAWAGGDPVAVALLAHLETDPVVAQGLHALAVAAGIARSAHFLHGTAEPARLTTPSNLPGAPHADAFVNVLAAANTHREQPRLQTVDNVLSMLECEYVMSLAAPSLEPSFVHDPVSGRPMRHPIRSSHSMAFPGHDGDIWLRQLQRRLAVLAGQPFIHAERLAVLRYGVGDEYRPHRDYLRGDDLAELRQDRPGQRVTTAFCYLNEVDSGGETDFPLLQTRISPRRGRVVLFDNVRADGLPDPDTLHAGRPVERGEKWLATLWFRQRPLRTF